MYNSPKNTKRHPLIMMIFNMTSTHPIKMIPIPAMVYFINDPDIHRSGRGMGGPTTLVVGEALYKI